MTCYAQQHINLLQQATCNLLRIAQQKQVGESQVWLTQAEGTHTI